MKLSVLVFVKLIYHKDSSFVAQKIALLALPQINSTAQLNLLIYEIKIQKLLERGEAKIS